jgi:hypothetical protein
MLIGAGHRCIHMVMGSKGKLKGDTGCLRISSGFSLYALAAPWPVPLSHVATMVPDDRKRDLVETNKHFN